MQHVRLNGHILLKQSIKECIKKRETICFFLIAEIHVCPCDNLGLCSVNYWLIDLQDLNLYPTNT